MDVALNLTTETVEQAMVNVESVEPTDTVREVFSLMNEKKTGSVVVCREGKLLGIFTERDALGLMAQGADLDVPVETVMTAKPDVLRPDNTIGAAIQSMAGGGYRRLPIVGESGEVLGVLKSSGVVRYLVEHFPKTVYNLPPEPDTVMQEREGA